MKNTKYLIGISLLLAIIIVGCNYQEIDRNFSTNNSLNKIKYGNQSSTDIPKGDILVSFRIDDITFESYQKKVLENSLSLAHKYNITFDLAVIANPFDKKFDPSVFKIYEDHKDVFEIVAHGLTHTNPINSSSIGEFYDITNKKRIPYSIQEEHIKNMSEIFYRYNLTYATKIFVLPFHTGDNNTIQLSKKYGYKIIVQNFISNNGYAYYDGDVLVSREVVGINLSLNLTEADLSKSKADFLRLVKNNRKEIQIFGHLNNYKGNDMEKLISWIVNNKFKLKLKFGFISKELNREK
ncbi:MAG: DUF2334 domain-containing protein [Nanoarchaeota archaeon]